MTDTSAPRRGGGAYSRLSLPVRLAYLAIALVYRLFMAVFQAGQGRATVLCYHGVTASERERFCRQMRRLAGRAVAVTELSADSDDGNSSTRVCVTFDDAFACLLDNALPATLEYGIPVTIFVPTSNLGRVPGWDMPAGHPEARERVMTLEEIRGAFRPGRVDFGSHTAVHACLPRLDGGALSAELSGSRRAIADILGIETMDIALPYGAFDDRVLAAACAVGYRRIFTLEEKTNGLDSRGVCGRFLMSPDVWPIEFRLTCAGAYAWLFGWRRFWRGLRARRADSPVPATHS